MLVLIQFSVLVAMLFGSFVTFLVDPLPGGKPLPLTLRVSAMCRASKQRPQESNGDIYPCHPSGKGLEDSQSKPKPPWEQVCTPGLSAEATLSMGAKSVLRRCCGEELRLGPWRHHHCGGLRRCHGAEVRRVLGGWT